MVDYFWNHLCFDSWCCGFYFITDPTDLASGTVHYSCDTGVQGKVEV